jgi:hypothetical protein
LNKSIGTAVVILGVVCVVLGVGLAGVLAYYVPMLDKANNEISAQNSEISLLETNVTGLEFNVTKLQYQISWGFLTPTINLTRVAIYPSDFENMTIAVEGKLTGPYGWMTRISWSYELSNNGTALPQTDLGTNAIGVNLGTRGRVYSGEDVVVTGIMRKGYIGTLDGSSIVSYYIEAEYVVPT